MPTTQAPPAHLSVAGLKARGWTDAQVRTLLGEPDLLVDNPHHRSFWGLRTLGRRGKRLACKANSALACRQFPVLPTAAHAPCIGYN